MNKNNIAMYMPFINALANGEKIEVYDLGYGAWNVKEDINFTLPPGMYRVKSEPKCVFVNEYEGFITAHSDKYSALAAAEKIFVKRRAERIAVKYIEAGDQT